MRDGGLRARFVQVYRTKVGTHRWFGRQPNRVRRTQATRPNQIWVGDLTYLAVGRMTRGGAPDENAHIESFFHSLKAEAIHGRHVQTVAALRRQLCRYMRYYNHRRLHSALDYQSPVDYERGAA